MLTIQPHLGKTEVMSLKNVFFRILFNSFQNLPSNPAYVSHLRYNPMGILS